MITDVAGFLGWFESVHRRTLRDVSILPPEAEAWRPETGDGENAWGIPELVRHTAEARGYFAGAFAGEGWVWDPWPDEVSGPESWTRALEASMEALRERLERAPDARLREKTDLIGEADFQVSAWRILMMMAEHEVAHRAQIGAYAGLNGWPVAQIFGRTNEWVVAQREREADRRQR